MAVCAVCDKKPSFGNKISITRSNVSRRTSRMWKPNLRSVKTVVNGETKKIKVCAKCLRAGKAEKA